MTITLAAVYTPIALQGGLTGALFREFALTLAGAVAISGVVALVLSPMMCAYLLRAEHVDHGFSGWVNRTFDRFRDWYGSHLDRTLAARPAVYVVWVGLSLIAVLMFMMIPKVGVKELAPTEDQGVIFGIMTAPANATIDDTIRYADAAGKVFKDIPDTRFTFQLTFPDSGFGGMVLKPWGEREDADKRLPADRAARTRRRSPASKCSRSCPPLFPARTISRSASSSLSTADQEQILGFAKQIFQKAMEAHIFQFGDIDTKIDQPQAQDRFRSRQGRGDGARHAAGRRGSLGQHRRQFRQSLQHGGPQLQGHPTDQARRSLESRAVRKHLRYRTDNKLIPLARLRRSSTPPSPAPSIACSSSMRSRSAACRRARSTAPSSFSRTKRTRSFRRATSSITPAKSRQLRTEGSKFLGVFVLSFILIFLVLAAQFNSFRDPFIILLGSVPLAMFGAGIFMFLKMPYGKFFTDGWTTTFNIYSQVGLVTLVGLISKNGILIVQFANELQRQGLEQARRSQRKPPGFVCAPS